MSAPFSAEGGFRPLTHAEVQSEIGKLDLTEQSRIRRAADIISHDLPGDGRDLLHDAVSKALTSRKCKTDLSIEQFLGGVMRSLASTKRRSPECGKENHVFMPAEAVAEHMGSSGYLVASADQITSATNKNDGSVDIRLRVKWVDTATRQLPRWTRYSLR